MKEKNKGANEIYLAKPEIKKKKGIPSGIMLICFVLIAVAILFFLIRPFITGYAASKGTFIDVLNFEADKSQELKWAPENPGQITSVRLSGELVGEGNAKVYLKTETENLLIYDSGKGKSAASAITGFALAPTEEEQSKADSEVKSSSESSTPPPAEQPPVEPVPSSPAPAETPPTEQPPVIIPIPLEQPPAETPSNETPPSEQPAENITKEKIKKFKQICEETCLLDGLNETEYTLVVEVDDGTKINLQEIIYTLKKEEVPIEENLTEENITEILPVMNITNMTLVENITEIQIENVQEDAEIQAVIDSADFNNESNVLSVIFHHESANTEPIRIMSDYALDYSLDKNESSANENVTLTINDWNPSKYFEIKIGSHSQIIGIGDIPEYDVNPEVKNALGNAVNTTIEFEKPVSKEKGELKDGKLKKGRYDVKIIPSEGNVKEILINEVNVNETVENLINLDFNVSVDGFMNSYAIDPTVMPEFTSANITVTAKGNELYKCKNWNFSQQTCIDGNWIKLMDINPGQEYTFTLTPEDPGFGENATGIPTATLAFFMDDPYGGGDRGQDSGGFDECPIQLNDYGETTEKCGGWDCTAWTNGASAQQPYACSGGYNCSKWNGVTCAEYNCLAWTASGTSRTLKYCSGGWNCASWNGNYCSTWNCADWTLGTVDYDAYCSGLWNCESWTNGLCSRWNCASWTTTTSISKSDMYCSGLWDCASWSGNVCSGWNCTAWTLATTKYDAYPKDGWNCALWNGNICDNWQGNTWTLTATAEYDTYCDRWNCSVWNSTKKMCANWSCLEWLNTGVTDKDAYCSGLWNCTYWENFTAGTAPVVSLVAPANGYTELNRPVVNFTYNVTDYAVNITNCTFYLWNIDYDSLEKNQTNTTITKNVNQTFSYDFTLSGSYQWNISCTDSLNHQAWSENRNITVDVPGIQANVVPNFERQNFTIWEGTTSLNWNNGTLVCSGILNDTDTVITNCGNGKIVRGRTYRVQFAYGCTDTCTIRRNNAADYVDHRGVKGAGTIFGSSPTLGSCGVNDFGANDGVVTCSVSWNGADIKILNTGAANWVVKTEGEGFMYNITAGTDAITNNTSYLYATPNNKPQQSGRISISVNIEAPKWSNNQTSIVTTYSPSALSLFNVTWNTSTGISAVFFESNYSGSAVNYTMNNITGNSTYAVYNYSAILPAGTWYWRSNANDTSNQKNSTDTWQFTINPATSQVNLTLNGTKNNITVQLNTIVNLSCSVITPSSGAIQLYNNGTLINSGNSPISNATNFTVAGNFNVTCLYLSTQNYSASSETYYVNVNDTIKPIITVYSPISRIYNNKTIFVNFSASDNVAIYNKWFNNGTADIPYSAETYANSNEGSNTFTFYANDTSGNVNSTNVTFSVDTTFPSISIISPENITYSNRTVLVNISSSDDIALSRTWFYNGTANETYTIPVYRTFGEGSNTLLAWANDTAGNVINASRVFATDTTGPVVTITSPLLNALYNQTDTVLVKASLNENASSVIANVSWPVGSQSINLIFNGTQWYYNSSFDGTLYPGIYNITVNATDIYGSSDSAATNFIVKDVKAPSVTNILPSGSAYSQNQQVNISVNVTDYHYDSVDSVKARITYPNASYVDYALTEIGDSQIFNNLLFNDTIKAGRYNITITANDTSGNTNNTEKSYFTVNDITYPLWSSNKTNAVSGVTKKGENIKFNVTLTDDTAGGYYIFSFDDGIGAFVNDSAVSWSSGDNISVQKTITATRGHTVSWKFSFNDSAGNSNYTDEWQFAVANTAPTATDVDIKPDNPVTTDDLFCNYTYSDNDGDPESVTTFKWFKNNVYQNLTTQTISNTYTNDGEEWTCEVTPYDGHDYGNSENSTTETIGSSAPSIAPPDADSNSTNPKNVGESITFTVDWSDPDQPAEMARLYVCNTSSITSAGCSGTFCSTANSASDPLTCSYTALQSDNTTNIYYVKVCDDSNNCSGGISSGTFEVNHAPTMDSANITSIVYTNDVLTCSGTSSDLDLDSMTIEYAWFNNSALVSGENSSTFDCSALTCNKHDNITCQQTVKDEHGFYGSSMNISVLISNSAPVLTLDIPSQSWYTIENKTNAINLSSYFSDADNDVLTFTSLGTVNISVTINATNNMVSFSQTSGFIGTENVTFIANDSESTTNSNNVTLSVTAVPAGGHKHEEVPSTPVCTSNWQCSGWSACINGTQTRPCLDLNNCGTLEGKPAESQSCGAIPMPPEEYPAEITPEGYVITEGEGVSAEIPKAMEVSALQETKVRLKIKNTLNEPLENVDVKVNVPQSDYTPTPMHPYPTLGWSPAIATILGGIGIKSEADYSGLSGWKILPVHYDKIDAGQEIELPLEFTAPMFKDKNQVVIIEIVKNGNVILTQQVPVEILSSKFFAAVDSKSSVIKDVYVGYDNSNGPERKVTIEFSITKDGKALVFDYLGPYTIKAHGRLFIAQEYELSKKLASQSGLKLSLKMTEKGSTIAETEAAL